MLFIWPFFFTISYLEDELVGLAQFGQVLVVPLVLLDLIVIRSVEQQLLDVGRLQPVSGHVHQDLTQFAGGELQMGDEDGCTDETEGKGSEKSVDFSLLFFPHCGPCVRT